MKAVAKIKKLKPAKRKPTAKTMLVKGHALAFREIVGLIQSARQRAFQTVNMELIRIYWHDIKLCLLKSRTGGATISIMPPLATQLPFHCQLREFYQLAMPKTK